jgi:hypothetical protein
VGISPDTHINGYLTTFEDAVSSLSWPQDNGLPDSYKYATNS